MRQMGGIRGDMIVAIRQSGTGLASSHDPTRRSFISAWLGVKK